jgi:hypothetical protein
MLKAGPSWGKNYLGQQPEVLGHCRIFDVNLAIKIIRKFFNTENRHRL